jgi:hypothetical protein
LPYTHPQAKTASLFWGSQFRQHLLILLARLLIPLDSNLLPISLATGGPKTSILHPVLFIIQL